MSCFCTLASTKLARVQGEKRSMELYERVKRLVELEERVKSSVREELQGNRVGGRGNQRNVLWVVLVVVGVGGVSK